MIYVLLLVATFLLGPALTLWSINTLAGETVISISASTCLAMLWLLLVAGALLSNSKQKDEDDAPTPSSD